MGKTTGKRARLSDVASKAGVSQGTASNVFNRPHLVRDEVREHVLATARALGYGGPNPRGRLLRAGKVNAIGIATAEPISYFFTDPYARGVMRGISEACDASGTGISLVSAANTDAIAWNIRSALVDGFILFCVEHGPELVRLTRERQLPFIVLALGGEDQTVPALGIDNVAGARMAARHLAGLGHRRFAVLTLPLGDHRPGGLVTIHEVEAAAFATTRDRVFGYFDALHAFGIDLRAVPLIETHNDEAMVSAALGALFSLEEPPTAILAQSDRMALIAIRWLTRHGYDVPGDVSIVGFDGAEEGAASMPPLTTVAQPMGEIGRRAVEAILTPDSIEEHRTFPLKLVIRGSSAAPRM